MTDKDKMDKTLFVHNELQALLKTANSSISKVEYIETDTGEFVIVTIVTGYSYRINVTGNSLLAIASDVIKHI